MSDDERLIGEVEDPEGRQVVLLARIWEGKVIRDHPEVRRHAEAVLGAVATPTTSSPTHAQAGNAISATASDRVGGCSSS